MKRLISNERERVGSFVASRIGVSGPEAFGPYQAIGLEGPDGALEAGMVVCDFNGVNAWVHLAVETSFTRYFLAAGFDYLFNRLSCQRITGWVESSNKAAIRLNLHLGYVVEATLAGAARDGGDVVLMVMRKDQCRWLQLGNRYGL